MSDSTTPRALRLYRPAGKNPNAEEIDYPPRPVSLRAARRILRLHRGYCSVAVEVTRHGTKTYLPVSKAALARLFRRLDGASDTVRLSVAFGVLSVG
jgi:hypothetical protein